MVIRFALSLAISRLVVISLEMLLPPHLSKTYVHVEYRNIGLVGPGGFVLRCSLKGVSTSENHCWSS